MKNKPVSGQADLIIQPVTVSRPSLRGLPHVFGARLLQRIHLHVGIIEQDVAVVECPQKTSRYAERTVLQTPSSRGPVNCERFDPGIMRTSMVAEVVVPRRGRKLERRGWQALLNRP